MLHICAVHNARFRSEPRCTVLGNPLRDVRRQRAVGVACSSHPWLSAVFTLLMAVCDIAFVGAGSVVFTRELLFDILSMPELRTASLRLYDIDAERLQTAELMARRVAEQVGAAPEVSVHTELDSALDGVDFVINAVAVGGHEATRIDFDVPAAFGLRQTIGDTLGIGGIFRALRTFPVLDQIATTMTRVCPDAWLLNYTNPMSMNLSYLAARHPSVNALGLCHSVFWTVSDMNNLLGLPYESTVYEAAGVNHQAWLLTWEHQGKDVYPLLDAAIDADENLRRRVRVDMYRRVGRYPTETSEHSSEYLPWYLKSDAEIARLRIPVGAYLEISADNLAEYQRTREELLAGAALVPPDATEYAPQVIHAMTTDTPRQIHATVANHGLLPQLQTGLGVEVPTLIDGSGAHPKAMGSVLPRMGAALNRSFLNVVDLVTAAAVEGDAALVRQAAYVDPNAAASLTLPVIDEMVSAMITAHSQRLPAWLR